MAKPEALDRKAVFQRLRHVVAQDLIIGRACVASAVTATPSGAIDKRTERTERARAASKRRRRLDIRHIVAHLCAADEAPHNAANQSCNGLQHNGSDHLQPSLTMLNRYPKNPPSFAELRCDPLLSRLT